MPQVVAEVPEAARVGTMILSLVTIAILSFCLTRRIQAIKNRDWRRMPFTSMLCLAIYIDSFAFVFCTAVLSKAYQMNENRMICDSAVLMCLTCYMTTKILIYYFLVEKVYIIRSKNVARMKSKLWLFNFFGVMCPFLVLVVLNFVYRIAYISDHGVCIIGMKRAVLVPLITADLILNIWLTALFLAPLRKCYTYTEHSSSRLRTVVTRTFIGSLVTLALGIGNLSALTILDGEPGWVCLFTCNIDIIFSTGVLHWVTSVDDSSSSSTNSHGQSVKRNGYGPSAVGASQIGNKNYMELDERTSKTPSKLTTTIEACREDVGDTPFRDHAIAVKTHQVQEVEIDSCESRDSQERIVRSTV